MMFTPMSQLADMISYHAFKAQRNGPDSSHHLQQMIAFQGQAYAQRMNSRNHLNDCLWGDDMDDDFLGFQLCSADNVGWLACPHYFYLVISENGFKTNAG